MCCAYTHTHHTHKYMHDHPSQAVSTQQSTDMSILVLIYSGSWINTYEQQVGHLPREASAVTAPHQVPSWPAHLSSGCRGQDEEEEEGPAC